MKAAAISTPSTKLWKVSPTRMSRPLRPWSSAGCCGLVPLAMVVVAMPPQHQFLQHEEAEDAGQDDRGRRAGLAVRLDGVGQHLEEGGAEQRADGVADQVRHPAAARRQREERGGQHGEGAAGERGDEDPGEYRHGRGLYAAAHGAFGGRFTSQMPSATSPAQRPAPG
jgi:hypothetical protein